MLNDALIKFCAANDITLTPLRKDVLSILMANQKALGAYEVLAKLKKKRTSAEPTTVYRVLDFLVEKNIVHRLDSKNSYIFCATLIQSEKKHQAILLCCNKCDKSYEFDDEGVFASLKKFANKHMVALQDSIIEIKGVCDKCLVK